MAIRTFFSDKLAAVLLVVFCMHFVVLSSEALWAEEMPLRVAVIDTGDKPSAPPALLDLLVVELSQKEELVVLERQEIETALREQGRNLVFANDGAQDHFVAAGRILGADALVLISAEPPNQEGLQPIEARIVETRRGVRFGKTVLVWSEDAQAIAKQIESATEQIASRLGRVQNSKAKFTVISIAGFRTDELSQDAHRFRRSLESWLESWLANQPGVAVAERTKILPLIDERKLSDDLPAALGEADATIDGKFQLDFSGQQPQVELTLRVVRKDHSVAKRTLHDTLANLPKLRQAAGQTILELLAIESSSTDFDTKAEVKLLTDEARRLLTLYRKYEALDRLIIAYALDPDSFEIQAQLLQAGRGIGVRLDSSGSKFAGSFFPTALLLSDVARQVLDQLEQNHSPRKKTASTHSDPLFELVGEQCKLMEQVQFLFRGRKPSQQELVQQEWLRASIDDLFKRYLSQTQARGGPGHESAIYCGLRWGRYWAKTPQSALDQRRELFELAAKLTNQQTFGLWAFTSNHRFLLTDNKSWADRDDLLPAYEAYLRKLEASDHAAVRAVGQHEAANYSLWVLQDRIRAMRHYHQFIDLIVEDIIPNHPRLADASHGLWLRLNEKKGYLELTSEEAGVLWSRVILARWSPGRLSPRNSQSWKHLIKGTLLHLEEAGKVQQANHLLQTCIESLKKSPAGLDRDKISNQWKKTQHRLQQLQVGLQERHPKLGDKRRSQPTLAVECQPCLTIEQAILQLPDDEQIPKHHWRFTGIAPTRDGYIVSYAIEHGNVQIPEATRFTTQEWTAIARLDKAGDFQSATLFPEPFIYDSRRSRLEGGDIGKTLRPLVATDAGVFLSVPASGILWFPPDKPPVHFSSRYLEQPTPNRRPVPFEEARQLTPIDGKLYCTSSKNPMHPLIYELDYKRGKTTVLLDTRSLPEESPLWGRFGFSIASGPSGKLLVWALPDGMPPDERGHLFTLDLQDKTIDPVQPPFRIKHPWILSGAQHHLGLRTSQGGVALFHPPTLSIDWLIGEKLDTPHATSPLILSPQQFVDNKRFLLTSAKRPGAISDRERRFYIRGRSKAKSKAASDWLLYQKDSTTLQRLEAEQLPPAEKVWRYLIDDKNQILMMTNKAVFRITIPSDEDQ